MNDTADTGLIDEVAGNDAEAQFLRHIEGQLKNQEQPQETEDPEETEEPEDTDETDEETESDADDDTEADEDEDSEESEDKISLRINGKKASLEDVLGKTVHTVTVSGEDIEVDYDELRNGYQRGKDYANKTTEIKKLREDLRPYAEMVAYAKNDPQFIDMVSNYVKNGPMAVENPLLAVTDKQLEGLLDHESDSYDPDQAGKVIKARSEWTAKAQEREALKRRVQAETIASHNEWAQGEIEKARAIITDLGGDYDKDGQDVIRHLSEAGFAEEEINSLVDSRLALIAWEAAQYRKMKDGVEAPKARIGQKRKSLTPPKAMPAGQGKPKTSQSKRQRDTYRKAVNSQREEDWLAHIESRLKI